GFCMKFVMRRVPNFNALLMFLGEPDQCIKGSRIRTKVGCPKNYTQAKALSSYPQGKLIVYGRHPSLVDVRNRKQALKACRQSSVQKVAQRKLWTNEPIGH